MNNRETTVEDVGQLAYADRAGWEERLTGGASRTVVVDGIGVALLGCSPVSPGVGHVWLVFLPAFEPDRHTLTLVRAAKQLNDKAMEVLNLHRLQTLTDASQLPNQRLLELAGFRAEAVLTMFGPDKQDCLLYRKLKEN